ncbi:MAG TPA: YafY family protein [Phototrophicaceae bacterium]|jgi:predicted DNA-binding transcriptional regulator YafY|nr:YafY family protein [Phototrophicaceae bacterium]
MRADRLLNILMLLQARRKLTAKTLAEETGVSRRTILRDIEALSIAGIPIYAEGGRGGGISLDEHYQVALSGVKAADIRTLFISGFPSLLNDVGLNQKAEQSLLQLFAALPSPHQQAVQQIRQRLHIDPVWWIQEEEPLPFWETLQRAVFDDLCVSVSYEHRNGERVERLVEPYGLVTKAGVWYLVVRREDEFRTYRVARLHDVRLTLTHFQRQPDFDLASYWQEHVRLAQASFAQYRFTLQLTGQGLEFLKAYRPGNSEIIEEVEEAGWITIQVGMPSLDSAKMLVFGLGREVVILEPDELREAITAAAHEFLAQNDRTGSNIRDALSKLLTEEV